MSAKRKAESHSKAANRPRMMKSGESRVESERDSGFSDASSEYLSTMDTTDSDDSPCPVGQQGPQTPGSGPQPPQLAVVGGSYSSLSPMIIMNNVLLKQPGDNPPALKQWGFNPTMEVVQPVVQQPQVVFLQPVVSRQASAASKESSTRHRRPKKYLPIRKSYPKIAPHPGDCSSSSGRGTASSSASTSTSSSFSSGSERGSGSTSNLQDHCQKEKQQRSHCNSASNSATHNLPPTPSTVSPLLQNQLSHPTAGTSASNSVVSEKHLPTVKQTELTPSLSFTPTIGSKNQELLALGALVNGESNSSGENNHSDSDNDTRRKRFCNTYNILSKSGLLDITLRTKELLRQNRRTQGDLDRLKKHTDLFLQALRSGDTSIFAKLQTNLQEEEQEKEKERAVQPSFKAD